MTSTINPYSEQLIEVVGQTQDGGKLGENDEYSKFLLQLIHANTSEEGTVDVEELSSNLRYAISEFTKALKAVEGFRD